VLHKSLFGIGVGVNLRSFSWYFARLCSPDLRQSSI